MAVDKAGNVYITGYFNGSAVFGTTKLMSNDQEMFIARLDASGAVKWARQVGCPMFFDQGTDVAVDGKGDVYFAGCACSGFVGKYSPAGKKIWVATAYPYVAGIAVDGKGHTHVLGHFLGSATFGGTTLQARGPKASADVYLAELDPSGNWLRAVSAGGKQFDRGVDIGLDKAGNRYITGTMSDTATFGKKQVTVKRPHSVFVARLDPKGSGFTWAVAADTGGLQFELVRLAVTSAGVSTICGSIRSSATFGKHSLSPKGPEDAFVAQVSASGQFTWARTLGGTAMDTARAVAVDGVGDSYVAGYFGTSISLGGKVFTAKGKGADVFAARLNSSGKVVGAIHGSGTMGSRMATSIVVDNGGGTYVGGYMRGTTTFGKTTMPLTGTVDLFVWKIAAGSW